MQEEAFFLPDCSSRGAALGLLLLCLTGLRLKAPSIDMQGFSDGYSGTLRNPPALSEPSTPARLSPRLCSRSFPCPSAIQPPTATNPFPHMHAPPHRCCMFSVLLYPQLSHTRRNKARKDDSLPENPIHVSTVACMQSSDKERLC